MGRGQDVQWNVHEFNTAIRKTIKVAQYTTRLNSIKKIPDQLR
jgi:hypothetical protein